MATTDLDVPVIIGAVAAAFGSIIALFFKYMTSREKQTKTEREDAAKEARIERLQDAKQFGQMITLLGNNLHDNTLSNQEIASSTTKQAQEAEKRNGHLAELQLQSQEIFKRLSDRNFDAVNELKTQRIHEQIVDKQTVKHEDVIN